MRSVRDLSRGFDTMVERLDADERQRRLLLADVSHELRTPLTVIAGDLEAMIDGVHPADPAHLEAVLDETRVMHRLIEDLRTMALSEAGTLALHPRADRPGRAHRGRRALVRGAGRHGRADRARPTSRSTCPSSTSTRCASGRCSANLVANAIRHTPAGGTVTVRGTVAGPWLELRVVDTGPGIDPEVLPHVFERFVSTAGERRLRPGPADRPLARRGPRRDAWRSRPRGVPAPRSVPACPCPSPDDPAGYPPGRGRSLPAPSGRMAPVGWDSPCTRHPKPEPCKPLEHAGSRRAGAARLVGRDPGSDRPFHTSIWGLQ